MFIEFFKSTNLYRGKLKKINYLARVDTLNLNGMNKIWKIFETVKNEEIANEIA